MINIPSIRTTTSFISVPSKIIRKKKEKEISLKKGSNKEKKRKNEEDKSEN